MFGVWLAVEAGGVAEALLLTRVLDALIPLDFDADEALRAECSSRPRLVC